jgi:N,N'-diacetyllegionaminate synthase
MNFRELSQSLIIAEIGVNHEGNEDVAADLIRKAKQAGADAVKFQTFEVDHYISKIQPERHQRVSGFSLSREAFTRLAALSRELDMIFFSTPFGLTDVDFLAPLCPMLKISSGDITFLPLIRKAASTDRRLIVSTGASIREEIAAAIGAIIDERPTAREDGSVMLMHCVSAYPTPPEEAQLRDIGWLIKEFGLPVGYSDHTLGIKACELAIAAGAVAIEKHFTYRKENQAFHDHAISADPDDLRDLIMAVRQAEEYLGQAGRMVGPSEAKLQANIRRSLGAATDIPAGEPVRAEWLTFLRPAWGLPPDQFDIIVGRRLKRSVPAGDIIRAEDVEENIGK